jgi:diguanylate cyclase (GGDEF)-like protein
MSSSMKRKPMGRLWSTSKVAASPYFRAGLIMAGFMVLILFRRATGSFGISIGYLYIFLIVIAGLWFGVKGGVVSALVSIAIHLLEVAAYKHFPHWELASGGLLFRFSAFIFAGFSIGYFSQLEKRHKKQLHYHARYDGLTGCTNYKFTMELAERELARARRYERELTAIIIDIDGFKEINDRYGHLIGNEVLKIFGETLRTSLREVDVVGRYGGDEFLVTLPDTNPQNAQIMLQRIKEKLSQVRVDLPDSDAVRTLPISFSAGVAASTSHGENINDLLKVADKALYQAKRQGKTRFSVEHLPRGTVMNL